MLVGQARNLSRLSENRQVTQRILRSLTFSPFTVIVAISGSIRKTIWLKFLGGLADSRYLLIISDLPKATRL